MYIAFKWLAGLALAMWIAMCIVDVYIKNNKPIAKKGSSFEFEQPPYRNSSDPPQKGFHIHIRTNGNPHEHTQYDSATLHYVMFIAGAIAVSVFNKKGEIISYTKSQIAKIDAKAIIIEINENVIKTSLVICNFIKKYCTIVWAHIKISISMLRSKASRTDKLESNTLTTILLLKKIREYIGERKRLEHLLTTAVNENKNIKIQYQLETMAKNRLLRHIEDTQKKVKENRLRYVNCQHLYLVTHQENIFLKARVRKLSKDKENVEKDLMAIINKVYKSKNNELKAYCTRFIVKPRENVLDTDISMEVRKFLEKSRNPDTSTHIIDDNKDVKDLPSSSTMEVTGPYPDASLVSLASDAPRLKGLPGEYIWTVKDKEGIIEKIYEYDFESDFDNGDTIRRIREYSVYHDKDCLLDFSSSRNFGKEYGNPVKLRFYPANERFLTGSEAFQKFLQNNRNVISPPRLTNARSLLCV